MNAAEPDHAHCITCSDEGIEMIVVEVRPDATAACAADDAEPVQVMTDLVGAVRPGDVLLVHAGVALARTEASR